MKSFFGSIFSRFFARKKNLISKDVSNVEIIDENSNSTLDLLLTDLYKNSDIGLDIIYIIKNTVKLSNVIVSEIMTHRSKINAIKYGANLDSIINFIAESTNTRIPVYKETLDNICGFIHVKDILYLVAKNNNSNKEQNSISNLETHENTDRKNIDSEIINFNSSIKNTEFKLDGTMRTILFIAPSMKAIDLLAKMRDTRIHIAVVVDEYSCTYGLVTLENILEIMVGDIHDEHDKISNNSKGFVKISSNLYYVLPSLEKEKFEEFLNMKFDHIDADSLIDTVGGLVLKLANKIPEIGETIVDKKNNIKFIIKKANARLIEQLLVVVSDNKNDKISSYTE